jgi:hypothetical protein
VANAAVTLPHQVTGLHIAATIVWISRRAGTPATRLWPSSTAPRPMALLTVGVGTLLLSRDLVGLTLAVPIDAVPWALGTRPRQSRDVGR